MLVYTVGQGVYGFTLEPGIGEYLLSHEQIKIPEKEKYTPPTKAIITAGQRERRSISLC